ncbi:MAG: hypothetical protein AAF126_03080 [Chloroflexota bacterium]
MASKKQIAIQSQKAISIIEGAIGTELPKLGRDKPLLHLRQLQTIAGAIKGESATIPQRYLDAEKLARDGATKAEIVNALLGDD